MGGEDFKNFLIIKKLEEDRKSRTFLTMLLSKKWRILLIIIGIIFILIIRSIFFTRINLNSTQNHFQNNLLQINGGETVNYIASSLKEAHVIKSSFAFKLYIKVFYRDQMVQAGIYSLDKKDTLVSLANKIIKSDYAIPPVKIVIPEGSTNQKIAEIIHTQFETVENQSLLADDFSVDNILSKLSGKEGYLFPETYIFLPNATLDVVVKSMQDQFYNRLKDIFTNHQQEFGIYSLGLEKFDPSEFFLDETKTINLTKRFTIISQVGTTTTDLQSVISMASYLEGEANNPTDMRKVSGVLWSRLKLNYPLQIDAATSTYQHKGFTDAPINNPGLVAIEAAINPIDTGSIYYLTDNNGIMHYAPTYQEHLANIVKYLQ